MVVMPMVLPWMTISAMLEGEGSARVLTVDRTSAETLASRPGSRGSSPRDPAQALVPDLTVQAGKALDAHLCRLVDVLEQFNVVHVWITSPLVCPAFPGIAVDLPGDIRYNNSV